MAKNKVKLSNPNKSLKKQQDNKPNMKTIKKGPKSKNATDRADKVATTSSAAASRATAPRKEKGKGGYSGGGGRRPGQQLSQFDEKRLDRIREKDERKAKKEEKILLRKKEHNRKMKILTKKNRKGQPLMNGRMELLLEKIKKSL